jgi:GNAT superfamily N-acetyltransferase
MDVTIREYQDTDFESCKQLWRELTQRHRDIYFDQSIGGDDPGAAFEHYLKKTNLAGLWVVEQAKLVLGMAGLLVDGNDAEIEPIVIRSESRSQGIGILLIKKLKAEAKERGTVYLSIRPVARNIEAIKCFYHAGFSLLGHIDMFLDLTDENGQEEWKEGITIHGNAFRY